LSYPEIISSRKEYCDGLDPVVKLSNKKIAWIVKHVSSGEISTRDAAAIYGITQRRVQQLTKKYLEQGEIPKLNPNRRPKTSLTKEDKEIIDMVWNETRFGSIALIQGAKTQRLYDPKEQDNPVHERNRKVNT